MRMLSRGTIPSELLPKKRVAYICKVTHTYCFLKLFFLFHTGLRRPIFTATDTCVNPGTCQQLCSRNKTTSSDTCACKSGFVIDPAAVSNCTGKEGWV